MGLDVDVEVDRLSESNSEYDEATLAIESQPSPSKQSRIISRVLSPALGLWLRSQLEYVEDLELRVEAGDRQILSGGISRVSASATKAVYQGLHFRQIHVVGKQIQTNLRQMLRGKPFRLLTPFPVAGKVMLSAADLTASLKAPLLKNAIADFLIHLLKLEGKPDSQLMKPTVQPMSLEDIHIELGEGDLTFKTTLMTDNSESRLVMIRTRLRAEHGNLLTLDQFQCFVGCADLPMSAQGPEHFAFNLGSEVFLTELSIKPEGIVCQGEITVVPEKT